ncbi:MAG TPA: ABC transporter substrate-binding protein [Baekduia sp.]|nr:ABC transporter substrate-binding protein [Baekduia sp.]
MKRLTTALSILLAAAAIAACGERKEQTTGSGPATPVRLMLDYLPNADHAGIYAANAEGLFERSKLDLEIQTPSDPAAPLKLLSAGQVDLAISYEPEVLLARDKGAKIVSVAAIVQKPLTSIIAVKGSGVETVRDLRGKTVGTAGIPYQSAFLKTILEKAGLQSGDVKEVNVGFGLIPAMLSRKVDATLGSFWNVEGVQLQRRNREPRIMKVDDVGIPTYNELVLVARESDAKAKGPMIRRFIQALADGQRSVQRNPEAAVDALVAANKDLDRAQELAAIKATLPVFFPADRKRPFGFQNQREWALFSAWMQENELIKQPLAAPLTNEFLPGQGL